MYNIANRLIVEQLMYNESISTPYVGHLKCNLAETHRERKIKKKIIHQRLRHLLIIRRVAAAESRERAKNEPRGENEPSRKPKTNHSKSGLGLPSIVALVMVIDKSWTSLGKDEKAFYTGLKKFVDDYKPLVDSAGNIRCPCKSCRLVLCVSIKHLSDHISKYGFDPSYKTWIHHGEPDLPPPPPVIDNTRQPQMSDMTACLNDLSYIPLNNEQHEPTQGDIGETSNDPT
ncbi:hypothetical protein Tco_0163520 [Tanacetum coccineum]